MTMSKLYLPFLIAVVTSIAGCSTQAPPKVEEGQQKISVIIENISPTSGVLRVALYNSKNYWLSDNGIVRARLVMVDESTERLEFWGLPSGDYGIAVYHDINSNNVRNAEGPAVWYSDPFGEHAQTEPFPGSIRQYIVQMDNGGVEPGGKTFGRDREYGSSGTHAPN